MSDLLREPREVALNDVIVAAKRAAAGYQRAAEREEGEVGAELGRLAEERTRLAGELEREVRRLRALPEEPDPDRETVRRAVESVREVLPGDERARRLEGRERDEEALAEALGRALAEDVPESLAHRLRRALDEVRAAAGELRALRAREG